MLTASGLTFVGGTDDFRFRAFATATGNKLWEIKLPSSVETHAHHLHGIRRTAIRDRREHGRRAHGVGGDERRDHRLRATEEMMRSATIMRAGLLASVFTLMFGLTASTQAPSGQAGQAPSSGQADEYPKLPPGEGRDVMIRVCGQCHAPDSAADQDLDAKGWKSLVDDMAAMGADATDAQLEQIVAYLAKAFPPSK